jgi:predicted transcriptional regulator
MRGETPDSFAKRIGSGRSSLYKALRGDAVRDRTAITILQGLADLPRRLPEIDFDWALMSSVHP